MSAYDDYAAEIRSRLDSPDFEAAWQAYRESMEYFDGEVEIEQAAKARFKREHESKYGPRGR